MNKREVGKRILQELGVTRQHIGSKMMKCENFKLFDEIGEEKVPTVKNAYLM